MNYIYMHVCPDGKKYVGKTKNLKKRFSKNGIGYRETPKFYTAILKYGWDNISHIVLHETEDDCVARKLEREEIEKNNSIENGYNMINKIDSWKSPYKKIEKKRKSVIQYDLNGNEVTRYNSIQSANKATKILEDAIRKCCNGVRKSAGKFVWKYQI